MENVEYTKKAIFIGDEGVGKSNLVIRVADNVFTSSYITTIGIDFRIVYSNDKKIKLQLWDTAGQERFSAIVQSYFKGSNIIVYVFSVDNRESFTNIEKYIKKTDEHCDSKIEKLLIGNKTDISDRQVTIDEAEAWALEHDMAYLDFSAKNDVREILLSKLTEVAEKHQLNN